MDYIVVGDYFSKYLIMRRIPNSSTHSVIKELGMIFTEFGRPFVLKSDNGLCYTSREFHALLEFYKNHHITSSPYYPPKNEFTEALVGISKKLMEKSVKDGKLWNYGLLEYRVTPMSGNHSITFRGSHWVQAKNLTSSDSIRCWDSLWKHPEFIKN